MNTNQYTQKTLEALQAAQQLAVEYQHNALEPAHLLHALAAQENGLIPQLLQKLSVDPGSFAAAVAEKLSALPRVSGSGRDPDKVYISQATDKVLSAAAREAKAMGILTVGIVTIPFLFEGNRKIDQALDGVDEISKHVDALLVINNERLREIYPELNVLSAFEKADDTLSVAARSIAEIITMHGIINLDFRDVSTVLKDGGVAIMSTGYGEGENRVSKAIEAALHSPLLNRNDIFNSKKVLLSISFCAEKEGDTLMIQEMNEVHDFMSKIHDHVETKWALSTHSEHAKTLKITILATGFGINNVPGLQEKHDAEEESRRQHEVEKQEENEERREGFYGGDKKDMLRKRPKFYFFGLDDLDNEEVISMVELTPTYKRSKEVLSDIKAKAVGNVAIEPESANPGNAAPAGSVISFS